MKQQEFEDLTETIDISPNLKKLYDTVIPHLGHTVSSASMDLLDNGLDAGATESRIVLRSGAGKRVTSYEFYDNGTGMNHEILQESFRFAGISAHKPGDLGKYGVGGTAASFCLASKKTTITKQRGASELLVVEQDLDLEVILPVFRSPTTQEQQKFKLHCGEQGTLIILTNLRTESQEYKRASKLQGHLVEALGVCYHDYLGTSHTMYVQVDDEKAKKIEARDPLYAGDKDICTSIITKTVYYDGYPITVRLAKLDTEKILSSKHKGYEHQGLYFKREGRIIARGESVKGLWKRNPRKNAGRIEISFGQELDDAFGLVALKNGFNPAEDLRSVLGEIIKPFTHTLESKYRNSGATSKETLDAEKIFEARMLKKAASLDLPRTSSKGRPAPTSSPATTKKSSGVNKQKRGERQNTKHRSVPTFKHEQHPQELRTHWYEFDDDGGMTITINDSHEIIKDLYTGGGQQTQEFFRIWMAAECLVRYNNYFDTDEEDTVIIFADRSLKQMSELYKLTKK